MPDDTLDLEIRAAQLIIRNDAGRVGSKGHPPL
jgi:hypothetical protein